jgi:betaine lipid synthase
VQIGGGTGWNIEQLNKYMSVSENFSEVYLVDLSPSLCAVARKRFEKLGFENVHVVCTDARSFRLDDTEANPSEAGEERKADWISMSYSLSMIPE